MMYSGNMMLILHIAIAITSLATSGMAALRPSRAFVNTSYMTIAATLGTGTYLVFRHPGHLASACLSGLLFLGLSLAMLAQARRGLSAG